jgi:sulfoxide reductase heme-binding subunit YedZ
LVVACVVLVASLLLGSLVATRTAPLLHNKMLPWILSRTLGIASYLALVALIAVGIWLRHPWRSRAWSPNPESLLRTHVTLAACTVTLLLGHMTAIALDHYARVGWIGVFVPWDAHYRPTAVALGTLAFYGFILVLGSAALAGSLGRRIWYPIHTVSASVFCVSLAHGVLAGSDGHALRWLYVVTGVLVATVELTRWKARYANGDPALELE